MSCIASLNLVSIFKKLVIVFLRLYIKGTYDLYFTAYIGDTLSLVLGC